MSIATYRKYTDEFEIELWRVYYQRCEDFQFSVANFISANNWIEGIKNANSRTRAIKQRIVVITFHTQLQKLFELSLFMGHKLMPQIRHLRKFSGTCIVWRKEIKYRNKIRIHYCFACIQVTEFSKIMTWIYTKRYSIAFFTFYWWLKTKVIIL